MDLAAYFERIGFQGEARPDLATLRALHRAHLLAIPYENLDVQLGRPLTPDPRAAFDKLVGRRRGGWCYEMNGVFGAALEAIGFRVTRLAGGVMRELIGDVQAGNHLVLLVHLDRPWIADVGFGDGSLEPFPLAAGAIRADGFDFRLADLDGRWWRFHNHDQGGAKSYDFTLEPAAEDLLGAKCQWLQTAPESVFVQNALVQRWRPDHLLQLRGRVLREVRPRRADQRLIGSADAYVAVLGEAFDLDLPEAAALWPRICARHDELFGPVPA
ncbi:arylamine N-acetyltransferase family protein [Phenylobacterium sp.]|jgi:N-hydroxyarylamine O-acetyltransferase|uniref:arylamine N-acetyltransferase family protein n=1 Tax=Phenylobacterium sp. TaxID=1871053 RepID=UPI002F9433E9